MTQTGVEPAVPDSYWLEAEDLYYATAAAVPIDRPIYQGDVFADVPLPSIQGAVPTGETVELPVFRTAVMVVPHPCQCYHGDQLRRHLTVAPVKPVEGFDKTKEGAKDKFALLDLPYKADDGSWKALTSVADFGRMVSVPAKWLDSGYRVACLSHMGLGLLAKRMTDFQLRHPVTLNNAMAFTTQEWFEAFLMQAWVQRHKSLKGYSEWVTTPISIPGVGAPGEMICPYDVRAGAFDALMEIITGEPVTEPDEGSAPVRGDAAAGK